MQNNHPQNRGRSGCWVQRLVRHRPSKTECDKSISRILLRRQDAKSAMRVCFGLIAKHFRQDARHIPILFSAAIGHIKSSAKLCAYRVVYRAAGWRPTVVCNDSCFDGVNVDGVTMPNRYSAAKTP